MSFWFFIFVFFQFLFKATLEDEQLFIYSEEGKKTMIQCSANRSDTCQLRRTHPSYWTSDYPLKFTSTEDFKCLFKLEHTKLLDEGFYTCVVNDKLLPVTYFLKTILSPQDPKLYYKNEMVENNTHIIIDATKIKNSLEIECRFNHQLTTKTSFVWIVNDSLATTRIQDFDVTNPPKSKINLEFVKEINQSNNIKTVKCAVSPRNYKPIIAHFYITFATNWATLNDTAQTYKVSPGKVTTVVCEADGFPIPDEYHIKKWDGKESWLLIANEKVFYVTEPGYYLCVVRNHLEGKPLGEYVTSTATFFGCSDGNVGKPLSGIDPLDQTRLLKEIELYKKELELYAMESYFGLKHSKYTKRFEENEIGNKRSFERYKGFQR